MRHRPIEKCGQNVAKSGGFKKKDLVGCLKISNLQGLFVPRAGFENYSGILIFTAFYCTTDLQYALIINNIDIIAPVIRAPIRY